MFGFDQSNFGNVQGFTDFKHHWCELGGYGDAETCGPDAEQNGPWQQNFVRWGGSLITFGAALGGLLLGPIVASHFGRRPCISSGGLTCLLGCLLSSYLSVGSVACFMIGRFLTGFGIGVCCYALPIYSSEIATTSVRGTMGSLFQVFGVLGNFTASLITMAFQDWKFGMLLPGIAGALVALAIWFTPESPRYVMSRKGLKEGQGVLQKVRVGDVGDEAKAIHDEIMLEGSIGQVPFASLFTEPGLRKRVFVACWLQISQQLTGVNAFLFYAVTFFNDLGVSNPFVANTGFQAVMLFGVVLGTWLMDSTWGGRRIQLLGATFLMGPALLIGGFAMAYDWPGVVALIMVLVYAFGFQAAWGAIPWVYPSEIFSMAEKERAISLSVFFQYGANAVIAVVTPTLLQWSTAGTLFLFAALNIINIAFVLTFIKETKGVPLEQIPALFGSVRKENGDGKCTGKQLA